MKTALYFIELDDLENFVDYEQFIKLLPSDKQAQIHGFRFDIDKSLSLFSDLFVRYLACKTLNLNNANLSFDKNAYGKPYLVGFPDFHYNISHTRNAIAIGISKKPIGIDVEKIKSADLKIAKRFFCKNELNYILSQNNNRERRFYEIWTKKEACIKWVGKGLSLPLTAFDVTDIEISKMLNVFEMNDYIISVCNKKDFSDIDIIALDENQVSQILTEFARSDYNKV